jgi:hypothetical protein
VDYLSSFFDGLGFLENPAYGLKAIAKLICDEFQLAIDCRWVLTISGAPVS